MKKRLCGLLVCFVLLLGLVSITTESVNAAPKMAVSDECIEMIKGFEGFNEYPFWDHAQYTVGYGTKCPEENYDRYMEEGISEEEAEELLRDSVKAVEDAVNWFANKNGLTFTQAQFDALADFTYNCGSSWMTGESKFRAAVINGTSGNEFVEVIASWCTASGKVYSGLIVRRLCEANLYLNGVYGTSASSFYSHVLYNAHGGSLSATGYQVFPAGTTADFRLTATRSGYEFLGWYTKSSDGTLVTALDSSLDATVLHAYWNALEGTTEEETEPEYEIKEVNYQRVVSVSNYLNVREKPDSSSDALDKLANGTVVTIVAETTVDDITWGKLSDGGWICLKYTNESPKTEEEDKEESTDESDVTTTTILNIRSGAGTNHEVTGALNSGETVTITKVKADKDGTLWGKLADGGWICLTYTTYRQTQDDSAENKPEEKPTEVKVKVTNGPLNVRSGAGTSYGVAKTLNTGDTVTIVETKNESNTLWGKLADGGWICLTYTDYSTTDSDKPNEETSKITVKVTDGPLNVRTGAGTSYGVQKTLAKGASVTIVSTKKVSGTVWGELSSGGWICLAYTDYAASADAPSSGNSGSAEQSKVMGTVNTSGGLNVRSDASTSAQVVGTYENGTKVEILKQKTVDGVVWGKTVDGWICMNYVKTSGGASTATAYTVTGDAVNVRSGVGTSYDVVKTVTKGTKVTITTTKTDASGMTWGQISGDGWISMNYVA